MEPPARGREALMRRGSWRFLLGPVTERQAVGMAHHVHMVGLVTTCRQVTIGRQGETIGLLADGVVNCHRHPEDEGRLSAGTPTALPRDVNPQGPNAPAPVPP